MSKIRAISLWEPWASLIATGAKTVETRGYHTNVRGKLLICAAMKRDKEAMELLETLEFQKGLSSLYPEWKPSPYGATFELLIKPEHLNFGKAVAVVELHDCLTTQEFLISYAMGEENEEMENELEFGDYSDGRYSWLFKNIRRIKEPFPVKGKQGFFFVEMPEGVEFV